MQCLAHPRGRDSVTRQEIQEIKPQISRIQAVRRGGLAAEEEMLNVHLALTALIQRCNDSLLILPLISALKIKPCFL
jgi:hypothetical protein